MQNENKTFEGFNLKFHQSILVSNVSRFYVNQNGEVSEVKEKDRDFIMLLAFASSNLKGPEILHVDNYYSQNFSFYLKDSDE